MTDPDETDGTSGFLVEREPGGPTALIQVAPLVDGEDGMHWYVVSVGGHSDTDLGASVLIRDGAASVRAPTDRAHSSADLHIGHGAHQVDATGSSADFALDLDYEVAAPGHFLVIWRDGDGRAVAAWANPLPAGTFAAG